MSKEAMKLALGKIKSARDCHFAAIDTLLFEAEEILEKALAEQQEPVTDEENEKFSRDVSNFKGADPEATKHALEEFLKGRMAEQPAPVPEGMVLLPKRMTQAMRDVTDQEDWTWEELLAAAEAITENEYNEIALAEQPAQQERTDYAVHLSHCNIGECEGVCKYLDDDCPALKHADMKAKWDSPSPQPAQQEPVAGKGKELSERLKLCARNVAFVAAGRVDMSSAAMQEMFALIDHVCVGLDSPPAQRTWVGLTDEEIEQACVPLGAAMLSFTEVARAIEAKLKEKNT
jgi:hypothetical protein